MERRRLVILASGVGTTLEYLWEQQQCGKLAVDIALAVSDKQCPFIEKAIERGIPYLVSKDWELVGKYLQSVRPHLVLLAGFMRVVPSEILQLSEFINIHPACLPEFPGKDPQRQALAAGVKTTGVTIHIATEQLDAGPILLQKRVPILEGETEEHLSNRLKFLSYRMLSEVLEEWYGWGSK